MAARSQLVRVALHRPVGVEDEQRHVALAAFLERGDELPPVHHRHHQIEEDDGGLLLLEHVEGFAAVGRHQDAIALGGETQRKRLQDVRVIVHDQNGRVPPIAHAYNV